MKKLTLFKLALVVAMALALYGQGKSASTCPPICFHLTCGDGQRAHCVNGRCVCP